MDQSIQRLLNDKLYDKRKQGALEYVIGSFDGTSKCSLLAATPLTRSFFDRLEKIVRDAVFRGEHEKIARIVEQLCHDYAYAVHQPHARNGGLIGLAAASIALGSVS
jgi:vacuole morphology and inheritance protein 14